MGMVTYSLSAVSNQLLTVGITRTVVWDEIEIGRGRHHGGCRPESGTPIAES